MYELGSAASLVLRTEYKKRYEEKKKATLRTILTLGAGFCRKRL
jgi:hypothetical protein